LRLWLLLRFRVASDSFKLIQRISLAAGLNRLAAALNQVAGSHINVEIFPPQGLSYNMLINDVHTQLQTAGTTTIYQAPQSGVHQCANAAMQPTQQCHHPTAGVLTYSLTRCTKLGPH
jgi:hypothetical protein